MKILSCSLLAFTVLTSAALAQTPSSAPTTSSHHKKAKHTHTLRHKTKHKNAHATPTPSATTAQPEAVMPTSPAHI